MLSKCVPKPSTLTWATVYISVPFTLHTLYCDKLNRFLSCQSSTLLRKQRNRDTTDCKETRHIIYIYKQYSWSYFCFVELWISISVQWHIFSDRARWCALNVHVIGWLIAETSLLLQYVADKDVYRGTKHRYTPKQTYCRHCFCNSFKNVCKHYMKTTRIIF